MRVALLVPAGFALGAAVCGAMLRHAPGAFAADRAQPLAVVTYWQQFGTQMWLAFAIAIAIASVGYVLWVRGASANSAALPRLRVTVAMSALACGAALLFPVVFSSDVLAYAGYGDMALHGMSPYAHAHLALHDPLMHAVFLQWGNPPPMCVYGPAFVWLAKAIVALFLPLGPAAPLWAFRVLACAALVACAPLAYAAFAPFPASTRLAAAAGIALNPVAIWTASEGHNDVLALAVVLGGFALAARGRVFTGIAVVALSALIKAPGALAAVAFVLTAWPDRARFVRAAGGAALGLGIVAAIALPLEYGVRAQLVAHGQYFPQFSLQYVSVWVAGVVGVASAGSAALRYLSVTPAVRYLSVTPGVPPITVTPAVPPITVTPAVPPVGVTRGGDAWCLLAFAAFVAVPNPYPWYTVWLLPVAFLAWRTQAAWALVALSLLMAVRYYPDATTFIARPESIAIVAVEFGFPLALLSAHMASVRRARREIRTTDPGFATPRSP